MKGRSADAQATFSRCNSHSLGAVRVRLKRLRSREYIFGLLIAISFATAPVLQFWVHNRTELSTIRPVVNAVLIEALTATTLTTALVIWLQRASHLVIGCVVGANGYLFFQWQLFDSGPYWLQHAQWILTAVGVSFCVAVLARRPAGKLFVVLSSTILFAVPGLSLLANPRQSQALDKTQRHTADPGSSGTETKPNVYFIVTDGYGRADQLERVLDYDDGPFIDDLGDRGFDVRTDSFSCYPATFLSIVSMLEMDHIAIESHDLDGGSAGFYRRLRGDNAAVEAFRERGYLYVHAESGSYAGTDCTRQYFDVCIEAGGVEGAFNLDESERAIAQLTPFSPLIDNGVLPVGESFSDPQRVIDELWKDRPPSPYFAFVHVLAPHAPYRLDANCDVRGRSVGRIGKGWQPDMRDDYVASLNCLHQQLLVAVDKIVQDDPSAIIVISGDHGSAFEMKWSADFANWSEDQIFERYATFHAVRVPERCSASLSEPEAANIVNALRIVIACVDRKDPILLAPGAFFYSYSNKEIVELEGLEIFDR